MTKKPEFLKLATVALLATGLLTGCATDGSSDADTTTTSKAATTKAAPAVKAGPSTAAKNAIYSAKVKNGRAKKVGYEWRDTGKIIKKAEKAAAKGDNKKAIALANKARDQAAAALEQSKTEAARFEKLHGTTTMMSDGHGHDSMMSKGHDSMMSASSGSDYTVISGDNLWNISAKDSIYGNPYQWPLIYKANAAKIKDADLIYAGQVFSIPAASSSDVSAAISHAKSRGAWTIGEAEKSDLDYVLGFK